ncbi:MAG: tetratricopeptide repeat protein [Treponema sp.]|nr:tetratricopeptide repeat protein [Treponema sp.]
MLSFLIAGVVVFSLAAILVTISTRKGGGKKGGNKQKGRAQIIRDATRKLSSDPHNPDGLIPLGELYYSEHAWEKAYPLYETMFAIAPAHKEIDAYKAAIRQGICAIKLNKLQEAFKGLGTAYNLRPDDFDVNFYLGQACYANNEFEKAVPCLRKALAIKPEATNINGVLGLSLYKAKHFKESMQYLRRALDEHPDNKEVLFSMADAMLESGYGDKAMKVFLHLRPDPEYGARSCLAAGTIHGKSGQYDKAIQDFQIGLKHQNVPVEIMMELHYQLAVSAFALNDIATGIASLKEVQVINPSYKDVPALMGRYLELNQNRNLQVYMMAASSDFVALCRKIVSGYYAKAFTKIQDINVNPEFVEIMVAVQTPKWEDTEVFRFYRSSGSVGELPVRDFHAKVSDSKADRGLCFTAGTYTDTARKYVEGRPIDIIDKTGLIKILKKIE